MFHFRHILDLQDSFDYVTIVACWLDEVHWDVACWAQDYFSYVKVPMDLSTIKKKLKNRDYEDAGECIDDFNLMFDNCATFNGSMDVSAPALLFILLLSFVTTPPRISHVTYTRVR